MSKEYLCAKWTPEEIQWLKENWNLYEGSRELARDIPGGRHTAQAILKMALRIPGLPRKKVRGCSSIYPLLIWWELQHAPATVKSLAERLGCSRTAVYSAINYFMEAKVIYICHWDRPQSAGVWAPVYAAGDGISRLMPSSTFNERKNQVRRLKKHAGNPFALILENAHVTETRKDELARVQKLATDERPLHQSKQPEMA